MGRPVKKNHRRKVAPRTDTPLVATELRAPGLPRYLIERRRLMEWLDEHTSRKVTLVVAPAGWGKTTLLSAWQARSRVSVGWCQILPEDGQTARLGRKLSEALRAACPSLALAPAADGARDDEVDRIVPEVVARLVDCDEHAVLVLDDYHNLAPAGHRLISLLIDRLPPSLHLVLAARSEPPLPVARLRGRGELLELGAPGLRFTDAEATALFKDALGLGIAQRDVEQLQKLMEGWAAGLYLAGLALRERAEAPGSVTAFVRDHRWISELFRNEVFDRQPRAVQTLLLRSAILDRFCDPLSEAVTGIPAAARRLERLEVAGGFVVPAEREAGWYRYHGMFAAWLRGQLRENEPQLIRPLHRKAAEWYQCNGREGPAVEHALAAGEYTLTGELIAEGYRPFGGASARTAHLVRAVPEETVRADPRLCALRAWSAWQQGEPDELEWWIGDAEGPPVADGAAAVTGGTGQEAVTLSALSRLLRGDVGSAVELAEQAVERAAPAPGPWPLWALGVSLFWRGDWPRSAGLFERAADRMGSERRVAPSLDSYLAAAYLELGDAESAHSLARRVLDSEHARAGPAVPGTALSYLVVGRGAKRGEKEGVALLRRGLELAQRRGDPLETIYARIALAGGHGGGPVSEGQLSAAERGLGDCIDPGVLRALHRRATSPQPKPGSRDGCAASEPLTRREQDILRLLATQLSLREIADELYLSHWTVKSYTKTIYRKLAVGSRADAIIEARRRARG